jgi:hypothetical protein
VASMLDAKPIDELVLYHAFTLRFNVLFSYFLSDI